MNALDDPCLDDVLTALKDHEPDRTLSSCVRIVDVEVSADCDDEAFFTEFFKMFGGSRPSERRSIASDDLHLTIRTDVDRKFGWFRVSGSSLPIDAREFELALMQGELHRLPAVAGGWVCLAFRGERAPAFAFRGADCLFALDAHWRRSVVLYLFWRVLRIRSDAVFFHAAALGICGQGTIFVGPAGAGKSTTSLALAARGHNFLSDELAGFVPERGALIPFRRPVGIRMGPRASAVSRGLTPDALAQIGRDGFARIDIDAIFPVEGPRMIALRRIVFLRGFAGRPTLQRIVPGRQELIALQPGMSSFLDVSHSRRIFDLTRMLARCKVYQLELGEPDETALYLEEAFARE